MKSKIIIAILLLVSIYFAISYFLIGAFPYWYKQGHYIAYRYYCSDVCPENGRWFSTYYPIPTREDCLALKGEPIVDPAFRAYIGCKP